MKFLPYLIIIPLVPAIAGTCASTAAAAPDEVPFAGGFPVTQRTRIYELSEVQRGDRGVGYTVFAGAKAEPFQVEVLGVMESMVGPGQDVILVRLSGPQIEYTGVISGMSGSPVFIDGRLLGAVAYRFGIFTREPIAGITPIRNMLAVDSSAVGPPRRPEFALRSTPTGALRLEDFRARAGSPRPWPAPQRPIDGPFRPIDTPIAVSGLEPTSVQALRTHLAPAGFQVVAGGGRAAMAIHWAEAGAGERSVQPNGPDRAGTVAAAPIAPASPVAIVLMRGAVNASALCTVTMVEGDRVYGCGHPFLGFGHVELPMATAAVVNTLSSEIGSWKQSVAAREVGVINQDRLTAIAGDLGKAAPMVPVRVVVRRLDQKAEAAKVTEVEIVNDGTWLPIMLDAIVGSAINRRLGQESGGTIDFTARYRVGGRVLTVSETFSAPAPTPVGIFAAREAATTAGILKGNLFEPADIQSIEVVVDVGPNVSVAEVVRVTANRASVRPGETVEITVDLKPYRQKMRRVRLPLEIPKTAAKEVTVVVGGSLELDRRDASIKGGRVPYGLGDLIEIIGDRRPARALYARAYLSRPGFRVQNTVLPDLPPTAQATLQSYTPQTTSVLKEAPGPEVRRPDPDVVVGSAELKIEIRQ